MFRLGCKETLAPRTCLHGTLPNLNDFPFAPDLAFPTDTPPSRPPSLSSFPESRSFWTPPISWIRMSGMTTGFSLRCPFPSFICLPATLVGKYFTRRLNSLSLSRVLPPPTPRNDRGNLVCLTPLPDFLADGPAPGRAPFSFILIFFGPLTAPFFP